MNTSENSKGKTTVIHFTSSAYGSDRTIEVIESYEKKKEFVKQAKLLVVENQ